MNQTRAATLLDRAISWLSPGWGGRRIAARLRTQTLRAYYDGATTGRRGASIRRRIADANQVTATTLPKLRNGARDLVRNNPHARHAVDVIVSNTIGIGMTPQFMRGSEPARDIQELADEVLGSTAIDAGGQLTYPGIQSVGAGGMVEGGDVLVRRRWRRLDDGLKVPVQFQLLEGDFLDSSRDGPVSGGGRIVQGVEFDAIGRRRNYWLFREHPGGRYATGQSSPVPARDVVQVARVDRPGQIRGIPWLAPVMLRVADFADYEEAELVRQKISACFVGFVEEPFDASGPTLPPGVEKDADDNLIDSLEPGMIERLPPGTKMTFGTPPVVQGYAEYSQVSLHAIAAGMGISYEALTGDLTGVNFSSGKMGRLEFERNIDAWRQQIVIPQMCDPLMAWFLEAAALAGYDTEGVTVLHIPPKREMIDPPRELRADRDAVRAGQKTMTQIIRAGGRDPVRHLQEMASDNKLLDILELVLDSDPRYRTSAGNAVTASTGAAAAAGSDVNALVDRVQELLEAIQDHPALLGPR